MVGSPEKQDYAYIIHGKFSILQIFDNSHVFFVISKNSCLEQTVTSATYYKYALLSIFNHYYY